MGMVMASGFSSYVKTSTAVFGMSHCTLSYTESSGSEKRFFGFPTSANQLSPRPL